MALAAVLLILAAGCSQGTDAGSSVPADTGAPARPTTTKTLVAGAGRIPVSSVAGTISVGSSPTSLVMDSVDNTAFVVNFDDSTVSAIDTRSNMVTATIPVGKGPGDLVVDSAAHAAYVPDIRPCR